MNIVIVYGSSFPYGDASANHILSYSRELSKRGNTVTVLCLQPYLSKGKDYSELPTVQGEYDGVKYYYPAGTVFWPYGKFNFVAKFLLRIKTYKGICVFLKYNTVDVFEVYSPNLIRSHLFSYIAKKYNMNFVVERTELPSIFKHQELYLKNPFKRLYKYLVEKSYLLPDSWILETQTLVDYYKKFANVNAKFYVVPMTVEVDRFSTINKEHSQYGEYIAYCGNMLEEDGISILIKAFAQISDRYQDVKLIFAGYSTDTPSQKQLVENLGLSERILFLGRVSRDLIPQFLTNARILALASPTSLRSCATMPCKVGEYLCTGNPVVVTGLGEINHYLQDGLNAFLAAPDSIQSFADKLDMALHDVAMAEIIGQNGKIVALENFSSSKQTDLFESIFKDQIRK